MSFLFSKIINKICVINTVILKHNYVEYALFFQTQTKEANIFFQTCCILLKILSNDTTHYRLCQDVEEQCATIQFQLLLYVLENPCFGDTLFTLMKAHCCKFPAHYETNNYLLWFGQLTLVEHYFQLIQYSHHSFNPIAEFPMKSFYQSGKI